MLLPPRRETACIGGKETQGIKHREKVCTLEQRELTLSRRERVDEDGSNVYPIKQPTTSNFKGQRSKLHTILGRKSRSKIVARQRFARSIRKRTDFCHCLYPAVEFLRVWYLFTSHVSDIIASTFVHFTNVACAGLFSLLHSLILRIQPSSPLCDNFACSRQC
jgi:hypothetical protein